MSAIKELEKLGNIEVCEDMHVYTPIKNNELYRESYNRVMNDLKVLKSIEEKHQFIISAQQYWEMLAAKEAIKIIKEKNIVSVWCNNDENRYFIVIAFSNRAIEITKEQYDLLKEVLL